MIRVEQRSCGAKPFSHLSTQPGGLEFDAPPWNDLALPAQAPVFADVALLPAPNYPFESHYPVIHGIVQDTNLVRVPGARVTRRSWVPNTT